MRQDNTRPLYSLVEGTAASLFPPHSSPPFFLSFFLSHSYILLYCFLPPSFLLPLSLFTMLSIFFHPTLSPSSPPHPLVLPSQAFSAACLLLFKERGKRERESSGGKWVTHTHTVRTFKRTHMHNICTSHTNSAAHCTCYCETIQRSTTNTRYSALYTTGTARTVTNIMMASSLVWVFSRGLNTLRQRHTHTPCDTSRKIASDRFVLSESRFQ